MKQSACDIGKELVEQLSREGCKAATLQRAGARITLQVADSDRLGILLQSIQIDRVRGEMDTGTLRRRLKALGKRVDYLPERLILVEHDPARTGALMRSETPSLVGPDREYFEFRVEKNRASTFHRFRQPPGSVDRVPVPTLLDRSTLARLVDDLLTAVKA